MNSDKSGRKRSANFSHREKENLIYLVEKYFNFVENKKTNAVFNKEKTDYWEKIAREFNATQTTGLRTGLQLRSTYEKMKQIAKKHKAEDKVEILKTGGGVCTPTLTDMDEKILNLLKKNFFCIENNFDSNSVLNENIKVSVKDHDQKNLEQLSTSGNDNKENSQSIQEIILICEEGNANNNIFELVQPELSSDSTRTQYVNDLSHEASTKLINETTTPVVTPSTKNISEKKDVPADRRKKRKFQAILNNSRNADKEVLKEKKMEVMQKKIDPMAKMELVEDANLKSKMLDNEIKELIKQRGQLEIKIKEIEYRNLCL